MEYNTKNKVRLTNELSTKILKFAFMDDLDFYEEFTRHLSDVEQKKFFEDNLDFMSEYPINYDKMYLMKDKIFRGILGKIKRHEKKND